MSEKSHVVCNECGGKGCDYCHKGWECEGTGCKKCIIFGSIKNDSETSSMVTEKSFGYGL